MTRSRVNSESHEDPPKSFLRSGKDTENVATIKRSVSDDIKHDGGPDGNQSTLHTYQKNPKPFDNCQHSQHGAVAMIERQQSKTPVLPTPTSTERKFTESFYWMSHLHKKIGLSHIILMLVLAAYTALGAVVFYYLETPHERLMVAERKAQLDARIDKFAEHITSASDEETVEEFAQVVKQAYIDLLNVEGSYKWSTFYRSADPENNYKWTYASSFFFAMNVYTTTGYGLIAPETFPGQWFVIIYGFIFVPVSLVVIRDLGQWLLLVITKIYAKILLRYRRCRGKKSDDSNEVIRLPIFISCLIMIGFIVFCTTFVYYLDALYGPPGSSIDFFHAFYFSYMSFTTIGLGDVMPNNLSVSNALAVHFLLMVMSPDAFSPIISIVFFLGLPVMKVVNRMTYLTVENGAFGLLTVIENRIDNYWKKQQPQSAGVEVGRGEGTGATTEEKKEISPEWVNNLTINSIATFMKSNQDVYAGGFGKVNLRAADVLPQSEQDTIRCRRPQP